MSILEELRRLIMLSYIAALWNLSRATHRCHVKIRKHAYAVERDYSNVGRGRVPAFHADT